MYFFSAVVNDTNDTIETTDNQKWVPFATTSPTQSVEGLILLNYIKHMEKTLTMKYAYKSTCWHILIFAILHLRQRKTVAQQLHLHQDNDRQSPRKKSKSDDCNVGFFIIQNIGGKHGLTRLPPAVAKML